jgi:hypothetical protein
MDEYPVAIAAFGISGISDRIKNTGVAEATAGSVAGHASFLDEHDFERVRSIGDLLEYRGQWFCGGDGFASHEVSFSYDRSCAFLH